MTENNPGGLPRGMGSMQVRGRVWWLIYTGIDGTRIQENSHTEDQGAARCLLTRRALATARARVTFLESLHEDARRAAHWQDRGRGAGAGSGSRRTRSGAVSVEDRGQARRGGRQ